MLHSGSIADKIRKISLNDLLGRDTVYLNDHINLSYINGETILVTGGGGSIGSELCRQIAIHSPKKLIILDFYENNAYEIQQELLRKHGCTLNAQVEICSVRDIDRLERVFEKEKPTLVFHAAAHKHVPFMEHNPEEAVKNNVIGTYNTALCADKYGVKKFILVSTDKAVNPTNFMGASKRCAEKVIQSMAMKSNTIFAAVRFGNVIGSNGSVIPLFKKQIEDGGPVTVTHPEMVRYFMTIFEASQLVIKAGDLANSGEIFVLDMGEPVKILDLAENMIRLVGLRPYKDIAINFTGLRPGEKLYEELLLKVEEYSRTENNKIYVAKPVAESLEGIFEYIEDLREAAESYDIESLYQIMSQIVPSYTPWHSKAAIPSHIQI
jgi:FlaA1/EpsC-like NDP-sugar epimerase